MEGIGGIIIVNLDFVVMIKASKDIFSVAASLSNADFESLII